MAVLGLSTTHAMAFTSKVVLGSLMFNIEDTGADSKAPPSLRASTDSQASALAIDRLRSCLRANSSPGSFADKLLRDVRHLKRLILEDDERVDAVLLAAMLSERGYSVLVRCALGGTETGAPGSCFRNLRHEFVFVRCDVGEYEGVEMLVDPNFREQFAIPQPTQAFSNLLQQVPEEFVGSGTRLMPIVELICAEMAASFEARGLTLPPWRRASAMLSKWLPAKMKDLAVDSAGGSPRSPSPAAPNGHQPLEHAPGLAAVAERLGHEQAQPASPARRYHEAAQQLETLALHNQQQASPTRTPQALLGAVQAATERPCSPATLLPPPATALWGNTPFHQHQQPLIYTVLPPPPTLATQLVSGTPQAELVSELSLRQETDGGSPAGCSSPRIPSFSRYSEPLMGRRSVSLLSVQLAGGKPELSNSLSSSGSRNHSAGLLTTSSSGKMLGQAQLAGALGAAPALAAIEERPTRVAAAVGHSHQQQQQQTAAATVTHLPPPDGWNTPVIHKVKYTTPN